MSFFGDGADDGGSASSGSPDPRRERPGGRLVVGVLVLLALVLGGGYVAAHEVAGAEVPLGTTVAGVDVGGMTRAAAEDELRDALGERSGRPLEVRVAAEGDQDRTDVLDPADVDLDVDYDATLDAAGASSSWSPRRQWDYFTGGDEVDPVLSVDEAAFDDELARLSKGLGTPPRDGQVRFERSGPTTRDPVPGQAIDAGSALTAVEQAFLDDDGVVELSVVEAEPDVDAADVQEALDEFANPAMTAPVTLRFQGNPVTLPPSRFAPTLSMVPHDGELVPRVDAKRLARLVRTGTTSDEPVDATVRLVGGRPRVVPAEPGVDFAPDDVAHAFLDVLTRPEGKRVARVEAGVEQPDVTTRDARRWGIERRVSTFTTYFPYAEYRNVNIGRAGELIDGTVLAPGDTFSLNDVVGERTVANGFTTGTTIQNGIFVEDLGGGVSQMATTTFNAAFFAGLEDVEHKPHSVYIDRYPVGREATVAFGSVDLRFTNDTEHGVLISVRVTPSTPSTQGSATVSMYSTKTWDITARTGDRYDYVSPGTQTLRTPDCIPNTGYSGFSIDVWRDFRRPGQEKVVRTEKLHTDYIASDTVICKPPKGG